MSYVPWPEAWFIAILTFSCMCKCVCELEKNLGCRSIPPAPYFNIFLCSAKISFITADSLFFSQILLTVAQEQWFRLLWKTCCPIEVVTWNFIIYEKKRVVSQGIYQIYCWGSQIGRLQQREKLLRVTDSIRWQSSLVDGWKLVV